MPILPGQTSQLVQDFMSADTGKSIDELAHLGQSIVRIVTTPQGTMANDRDFGCGLFRYIDRTITKGMIVTCYALIASALAKWEPRLEVTQLVLDTTGLSDGVLYLDVYGWYLLQGKAIKLENLALNFQQSRLTTTA